MQNSSTIIVKTLSDMLDKPYFTFPTLASNCAACTAVSVIYNSDGTFKEYYYLKQPSYHTFINTKIVADSPEKLLWAGIGDDLSKECEVKFACRDKYMYHTPLILSSYVFSFVFSAIASEV
ncbi:glycerol dehydrogenase [Clostridium saccharobutylicum]|uniref:Glycerol dehydrogenase n=1 Tax=Clostridium saccharobutylicum TaxID=169679 RepID=A0A1S8NDN7_CLOSA|nr:glycerol dehydrogenase [Clostridium saccharobutylicum]